MKHLFIFIGLTVATLFASCSKDPATEPISGSPLLCLTLDGGAIAVQGAARANAPTRAATVDESAVTNLWVLQFDASGTQLTQQYLSSIPNPSAIKLTTELYPKAQSTLYVVANTGSASLFTSSMTLAQAKAVTLPVATTTGGGFPSDASTCLPMVGQSSALIFPLAGTIPINLTRAVAKVVLTVKNALTTGYPQLTVTSTQLKNAPTVYLAQIVDAANGFSGTTYYPSASVTYFRNYTALTGDIPATGTTSTYYLAPNARGIGSSSEPRHKTAATAAAGQGYYCTYVEIIGTARANADPLLPEIDVCYRLYLGGNNTNDFNIMSNTAYKVDIELTGLAAIDARLTIVTDRFDLVQGGIDGDNTGDAGNGWRPPVVGDLRGDGIVYWADAANVTNYKVVSVIKAPRELKWAAKDSYAIGTGAQSDTDGKANSAAIKAYYEANKGGTVTESTFEAAFPAAAYCYNYQGRSGTDAKGTWYLPAKTELQYLWCAYNGRSPVSDPSFPADATAQTKFNKYLTDAGGAAIITSDLFWSGTEHSGSSGSAWYVYFSSGTTNVFYKSSTVRSVRCIKSPPVIGDVKDGGIIYWVNADATKYKVVSVTEAPTKLQWAAKNSYVIGSGAQNDSDAKGNAAAIKAYYEANKGGTVTESTFEEAFPAAAWCYNYQGKSGTDAKGTWYLAAMNDLQYLYCAYNGQAPVNWAMNEFSPVPADATAQTKFNKYLTDAGGADMSFYNFWSGTEGDGGTTASAWTVHFSSQGYLSSESKKVSANVRCVREN